MNTLSYKIQTLKKLLVYSFITLFLSFFSLNAQSSKHDGNYYAVVNGVKHWYKIEGSKNKTTPIVIIHGGPGGNQYAFENSTGKELAKTHKVIYYEQRGCGRSDSPEDLNNYSVELLISDLNELINDWGEDKVILMGYSFGAYLATEFTLKYPEKIEALILESCATVQDKGVLLTQISNFYQMSENDLHQKIDNIISDSINISKDYNKIWDLADKKTVVNFLFYNPIKGYEMFNLWEKSKLINNGQMMAALLKKTDCDYLIRSEKINIPTLLLTGLYDKNGGLQSSLILSKKIKNSDLIVFNKSGHFPDYEEPKLFLEMVNKWLSKKT